MQVTFPSNFQVGDRPFHPSQVQPRRADGKFSSLSDARVGRRWWLLAIRLGVAHPDVVAAAQLELETLPSADVALEYLRQWVSARAAARWRNGQTLKPVRLLGGNFPKTTIRPAAWPNGAIWPHDKPRTTPLIPAQWTVLTIPGVGTIPLLRSPRTGSSSTTSFARSL